VKGLFYVAWFWPGQAGGVCLLRGFCVFGFAGGLVFFCFFLLFLFGRVFLGSVVCVLLLLN